MSHTAVVPIVEGHGDALSVGILIRRLWSEFLQGDSVDVLKAIRRPRSKLVQEDELKRAVRLASSKLRLRGCDRSLIVLMADADEDAPCLLGPELFRWANEVDAATDVICVLPNPEYETWFIGAAESLGRYLDLESALPAPNPEQRRLGKAWIQRAFRETKYSETVDQPRLTASMDLRVCRANCPSFDRLVRKLERRD